MQRNVGFVGLVIALGIMLAGCPEQRKPEQIGNGRGKGNVVMSDSIPVETPCTNGRLLSRHSYSVCINNTWHVVEDDYYECPPKTRFCVFDLDTKQPCDSGPPPSVIGTRFTDLHGDTTCFHSKKIADQVLWRCNNGFWEYAKVIIYQCDDGRTGIIDPPTWIPLADLCKPGSVPPFDKAL